MNLLKNQSPSAIAVLKWDSLSSAEKIEIALSILRKPFEERVKEDISILFKFTEKIQFFRDFDPETIQECCQYLTYFHTKSNKVIFKQGDTGRTFYIILSGSVGVYRDELVVDPPSELLKDDGHAKSRFGSKLHINYEDKETKKSIVLLDAQNNPISNNSQKKRNSIYNTLLLDNVSNNKIQSMTEKRGCVEISCLGQGSAFGERALFNKALRKATIISKEETHFACLDKEHFDKVLKEKQKRNHNENMHFLHELQLFKNFSAHLIEQIYYRSIKKKFINNQVVYSEGEKSDYVYIIKSGHFKVTKAIELLDEQDRLFSNRNTNTMQGLKKKAPHKLVEIAIYGKGELFGEDDITAGRKRENSVVCSSCTGELYMLPKDEFKSLLISDETFKICIQKQVDTKFHFHSQRLKTTSDLTNQNKHLLIHIDDSVQRTHTFPSESSVNTIINSKTFSKTKAVINRIRKYTNIGFNKQPLDTLKLHKSPSSEVNSQSFRNPSLTLREDNHMSIKKSKQTLLNKVINPNKAGDSKIRQYKRAKDILAMNKEVLESIFPEIKKEKISADDICNNTSSSKYQNLNREKTFDNRSSSENPKPENQKSENQKKHDFETKSHRKTSSLALSFSSKKALLSPQQSPKLFDNASPCFGESYRQSRLLQTQGCNVFTTTLSPSNFVYPIMSPGLWSEGSSPVKAISTRLNAYSTWGSNFTQHDGMTFDTEEKDLLPSPETPDLTSLFQHSQRHSKTFYGPINPIKKEKFKKDLLNVQNLMNIKLTGKSKTKEYC